MTATAISPHSEIVGTLVGLINPGSPGPGGISSPTSTNGKRGFTDTKFPMSSPSKRISYCPAGIEGGLKSTIFGSEDRVDKTKFSHSRFPEGLVELYSCPSGKIIL